MNVIYRWFRSFPPDPEEGDEKTKIYSKLFEKFFIYLEFEISKNIISSGLESRYFISLELEKPYEEGGGGRRRSAG